MILRMTVITQIIVDKNTFAGALAQESAADLQIRVHFLHLSWA